LDAPQNRDESHRRWRFVSLTLAEAGPIVAVDSPRAFDSPEVTMKGAVAFLLIVLMLATPATQVLAQTPQQQDVPTRQPVTPDVTLRQVAPELSKTNPMEALLPAPNLGLAVALNAGELAPAPLAKGDVVALKILVVGAIVLLALFALSAKDDDVGIRPPPVG